MMAVVYFNKYTCKLLIIESLSIYNFLYCWDKVPFNFVFMYEYEFDKM